MTLARMDAAKRKSWLALWDKEISTEASERRTCDSMMGEDIAWRVAPALDGFYYGYMATRDAKYVDMLVDWTDSLIQRAIWGQADAVGSIFLLLGLRELQKDRRESASALAVLAALTKMQLGILGFVVGFVVLRRSLAPKTGERRAGAGPELARGRPGHRGPGLPALHGAGPRRRRPPARLRPPGWLTIAVGLVAGVGVFCLGRRYLPLAESAARTQASALLGLGTVVAFSGMVFDSIASHLVSTFGEYPYLTLNAYNPWALVADGANAMDRSLAWIHDAPWTDAAVRRSGTGLSHRAVPDRGRGRWPWSRPPSSSWPPSPAGGWSRSSRTRRRTRRPGAAPTRRTSRAGFARCRTSCGGLSGAFLVAAAVVAVVVVAGLSGQLYAVVLGDGLLLAILLGVGLWAAWRDDAQSLLVALTILAIAFFVVPTRAHERYLFPFFGLGAVLLAVSWRWSVTYVVLAVVNSANLLAVLVQYHGHPGRRRLRWPRTLNDWGNGLLTATWFDGIIWPIARLRRHDGPGHGLGPAAAPRPGRRGARPGGGPGRARARAGDLVVDAVRCIRRSPPPTAGTPAMPLPDAAAPARLVRAAAPAAGTGLTPARRRSTPTARATRRAAVRPRLHGRGRATGPRDDYLDGARPAALRARLGHEAVAPPGPPVDASRQVGLARLGAARPPRQARPVGRRGAGRRRPVAAGLPPGRAAADALRRGLPRPDRDRVPAGLALRQPPRHLRVDPPAPGQVRHRGRDHALLRRQGHGHRRSSTSPSRTSSSSREPRPRRWPTRTTPTPRAPTPGTATASSWPPARTSASTTSRRGPWSRRTRSRARRPSRRRADRARLRGHTNGRIYAIDTNNARRRPGSALASAVTPPVELAVETGLSIAHIYRARRRISWPPTPPATSSRST